MTKRKPPPPDKQFKPGQSGNPGGRPKLPEDIKKARKLNQVELERAVNHLLFCTRDELQAIVKNPETPMLEVMVASIMAQAATKGDQMRLEFVLARLIGKVKDQLEVTVPTPFVIRRPSGETLELGMDKPKEIEE
jgi:hypothetical protein